MITTSTDLVVKSAYLDSQRIHYEFSNLIILIAVPGVILSCLSFVEILRSFQKADDYSQRNRMRYLLVALGLMLTGSLTNWVPSLQYKIDYIAYGLTAAITAYIVLKSQPLDIEILFRKSLLYTIPTTIIGIGYFLIITQAFKFFKSMSAIEILLVSCVVAILSAIVAQPLQEKVKSWVDRLFFHEKYESQPHAPAYQPECRGISGSGYAGKHDPR